MTADEIKKKAMEREARAQDRNRQQEEEFENLYNKNDYDPLDDLWSFIDLKISNYPTFNGFTIITHNKYSITHNLYR